MNDIQLVIFDMDGTILDTLDDLTDSVNFALSQTGYPARTKAEVRTFVGNGIRKLIERSLRHPGMPEPTNTEIDRVFDVFMEYYQLHAADKTQPYEGIIDCIQRIRSKGCKTAVVSNKMDGAVQSLCETYFKGLFDIAVGEKPNQLKKPAPDALFSVLEALSVSNENTIYVGDSEVDILTAHNAKVKCVCVDWGFKDRSFLVENQAPKIVSSPTELFENLFD